MKKETYSPFLAFLLCLLASTALWAAGGKPTSALKKNILEQAGQNLVAEPQTVTSFRATRSAGTIHDFYSEGDYWWPDPKNPDGPYIRRDGETNPDNFVAHRHAMIRFSTIVANLTSAYLITGDHRYVEGVMKHVRAWFVQPDTRMNPSLLYAQAIKGRVTGRGIGIIDTIHLMEVTQSLLRLEERGALSEADLRDTKQWFRDYIAWLSTHPYGIDEMKAKNNHGTCWAMQVAAFARFVGNQEMLHFCRRQFKQVFMVSQMAEDGSFPQELARTKPYGYSLFNLDAMAVLCQILSTPEDNLWTYTTADGKCMRKAVDYMYPYVDDKEKWPFRKDVMYWDEWPVAQPAYLFAWKAFGDKKYYKVWEKYNHFPTNEEVIRNLPIRNPLIWL